LVTTILTDLLSSFYAVPYHKDSIFSNLSHRNFTVIYVFKGGSLRIYFEEITERNSNSGIETDRQTVSCRNELKKCRKV
jgi:hypothetical protein